jgi:nucleoside diphosphate kinase
LTREQTTDLLQERMDESNFNDMVDNMVSGPVIVFLLQRLQVFEELQRWIGPENPEKARATNADTLVALYGKTTTLNGFYYNLNRDQAKRDIQFFFPNRIL